jgi:hypothetical protein
MLSRTIRTVVAIVLSCVVLGVGGACLFHAAVLAPEQTGLSLHRQTSAAHSMHLKPCLVAMLPLVGLLVVLHCLWKPFASLVCKHATPVFPLFIPPRSAVRASTVA